ncbi:hypothetical protein CCH79_00019349 [Gambusia affinis]|uniref:PINIT domain-containing protein n=1 Tax=Gambusia affinis TaxID=33528 RepID=A0A315UZA4_GAMAF|nr:hypothetical protein CCH79_00019349 [Gambusia affinis]
MGSRYSPRHHSTPSSCVSHFRPPNWWPWDGTEADLLGIAAGFSKDSQLSSHLEENQPRRTCIKSRTDTQKHLQRRSWDIIKSLSTIRKNKMENMELLEHIFDHDDREIQKEAEDGIEPVLVVSQPSNINLSLLTGETAVWYCAKTSMNLQQPAPLIPPVHPDVQMKPLPFYDVLDVLIKPSSLGASTAQRYHQEKYFIFALTPQQVREVCISRYGLFIKVYSPVEEILYIKYEWFVVFYRDFLPGGRRDYMVQIQLRFCLAETSCPQDDNFPNSLCIKVNGKLFPLPGFAPPPKNGVEQKRTGRPLNITSLVRLSSAVPNQISVTWTQEMGKHIM